MIVLSLFDGMACGYEALKRAGINVTEYYASEVDAHCINVAKNRHPDIIHLGDVRGWRDWIINPPDLIIGGSPCQGFSFAGKQLAFDDPRSMLFFDMVDIIKAYDPDKFFLENVRMKKEFLNVITEYMGVDPMFINSALVSAQNRQRYYWFNWDAPLPADREIFLSDIIEEGVVDRDKYLCLTAGYHGKFEIKRYFSKHMHQAVFALTERRTEEAKRIRKEFREKYGRDFSPRRAKKLVPREDGKMNCLTATYSLKEHTLIDEKLHYRKLSVTECERLQTLPDGYTEGVSDPQRYKMLGNGWNVETIVHIFEHMFEELY